MNGFEHFRLLNPGWRDVLEIALVSFVLYRVLLLFQRTRAVRILLGLVVLVMAYAFASLLKLGMITHLLGLAFHPNYATNGFFYVAYTVRINGGSYYQRISRFSVSASRIKPISCITRSLTA